MMRRVVLLIVLWLAGCQAEREAERVGGLVFEMLKTVPQRTMNDYFSHFISVEEVHQLAQDTSLVRELMTRERKVVEGIAGLDGQLFFSSEGQTFSVHIQALWNGEAYRLSAVDELHLLGG